MAAIPPSTQPDQEADRQELAGRAALLAGASDRAARSSSRPPTSAAWRSTIAAWRARCRFAGDAVLRQGRTAEAAVLFLRAGRSALLQGDTATGRTLLDRADFAGEAVGAAGVSAEVDRVRKAAAASKS